MKTSEIRLNTAYRTREGVFIPLRRSDWKQASFDGAVLLRHGEWVPLYGVYCSQFEETVEAYEERQARTKAAAEVIRRQRAEESARRIAQLEAEFAHQMAVIRRRFPEARLGEDYMWSEREQVPEVRLPYADYSDLAPIFLRMTAELNRVPRAMPQSSALAKPLAECAAGLPVEHVSYGDQFKASGAEEIEALARALLAMEDARD